MNKNIFKVHQPSMSSPSNQSAGILDDFAVRKDIQTISGKIENVAVANNDILNKSFFDSKLSSFTDKRIPYANNSGKLIDNSKFYIDISGGTLLYTNSSGNNTLVVDAENSSLSKVSLCRAGSEKASIYASGNTGQVGFTTDPTYGFNISWIGYGSEAGLRISRPTTNQVKIMGGRSSASGYGGNLIIQGGETNSYPAGDLVLRGGQATSSGTQGKILMQNTSGSMTYFDMDYLGNIIISGATSFKDNVYFSGANYFNTLSGAAISTTGRMTSAGGVYTGYVYTNSYLMEGWYPTQQIVNWYEGLYGSAGARYYSGHSRWGDYAGVEFATYIVDMTSNYCTFGINRISYEGNYKANLMEIHLNNNITTFYTDMIINHNLQVIETISGASIRSGTIYMSGGNLYIPGLKKLDGVTAASNGDILKINTASGGIIYAG